MSEKTPKSHRKTYKEKYEVLKKEIEAKEAQLEEYLDHLKRLKAEFENYKKRLVNDQNQFVEFASEKLITKLLPILDNLERALHSANANPTSDGLVEGLKLVYNQLKEVLQKEGLEALAPHGKEFDPQEHEAVLQVKTKKHKDDTIVEVLQRGYALKGKVLRAAMVKVAKH